MPVRVLVVDPETRPYINVTTDGEEDPLLQYITYSDPVMHTS